MLYKKWTREGTNWYPPEEKKVPELHMPGKNPRDKKKSIFIVSSNFSIKAINNITISTVKVVFHCSTTNYEIGLLMSADFWAPKKKLFHALFIL